MPWHYVTMIQNVLERHCEASSSISVDLYPSESTAEFRRGDSLVDDAEANRAIVVQEDPNSKCSAPNIFAGLLKLKRPNR